VRKYRRSKTQQIRAGTWVPALQRKSGDASLDEGELLRLRRAVGLIPGPSLAPSPGTDSEHSQEEQPR
jgi:hypothetical protein